eukprot:12651616-Prorocentrum_lima.AAC.1
MPRGQEAETKPRFRHARIPRCQDANIPRCPDHETPKREDAKKPPRLRAVALLSQDAELQ